PQYRLLTTKQSEWIRGQALLTGRWMGYGSLFLVLAIVAAFGLNHELLERQYPSPPDWSFLSRTRYRAARGKEEPESEELGLVNWGIVGDLYARVLRRLEDPNIDGAGLQEVEEGGILVPGVGKAGYDLSNKSETWRRGYFEVLMGCAQAAEHLDDHVLDTKRRMVFKKDYVIGPSNPDPKPIPPWMHDAPLEENCQTAYDPPEKFYLRILTSTGFTTKQRLDAALAYGNWLDYKTLHSSAEEMYRWALDIATSALSSSTSSTIDPLTAVIHPNATAITPNIIQAATSLAIHHASTSNLSAALPIFLSVLRARRAAPPPDPSLVSNSNSNNGGESKAIFKQQGATDIAVLSNYTRQFL
ncbi:hypothetical protein LTS18_001466, partial [Coniosporium uncinatum]